VPGLLKARCQAYGHGHAAPLHARADVENEEPEGEADEDFHEDDEVEERSQAS
jgi:hypothetical protein